MPKNSMCLSDAFELFAGMPHPAAPRCAGTRARRSAMRRQGAARRRRRHCQREPARSRSQTPG